MLQQNSLNLNNNGSISNEQDVVDNALVVINKKSASKKKKKKTRGKDKAPRKAYVHWKSGKQIRSGNGGNDTTFSNDFSVKDYQSNGETQSNDTVIHNNGSGQVTVDEMLAEYERKLDGDTKKLSDKTRNIIPNIDDYTGENIEDGEGNTTENKNTSSTTGAEEAKVDDGWSGEELVRMIDGTMALVNPLLVRLLTGGRKKIPRGQNQMTADDKKLLIKPANKVVDEVMENVTPMQQLVGALFMIEMGIIAEHVTVDDIKNLFKKKVKTENQDARPL